MYVNIFKLVLFVMSRTIFVLLYNIEWIFIQKKKQY